MVCCVLRGEPSAVPVRWVGAVLAGCARGNDPRHVSDAVRRLRPQVPMVIISTDGDPARLNDYGIPIVTGEGADSAGMVLAALEWTAKHVWETPWVATVPADGAPVPPDLVARLAAAVSGSAAEAACVAESGRLVLELGLWPVRLRRNLRRAIAAAGERSWTDWARGFDVAVIECHGREPQTSVART